MEGIRVPKIVTAGQTGARGVGKLLRVVGYRFPCGLGSRRDVCITFNARSWPARRNSWPRLPDARGWSDGLNGSERRSHPYHARHRPSGTDATRIHSYPSMAFPSAVKVLGFRSK